MIFTLKVWLTGMSLAFIGMCEVDQYSGLAREDHYYAQLLLTVIKMTILSIGFALPFFLCVWVLLTMHWSTVTLKSVLSVLTFFLGWLPFMFLAIVSENFEPFSYKLKRSIIVYILLNCGCLWFYKFNQQTKHEGTIQRPNL